MNDKNRQIPFEGKARPSNWLASCFKTPNRIVWPAILGCLLLVAPPFFFLIKGSLTVQLPAFRFEFGLENYRRVLALDDFGLWRTTLAFALGSSCVAIGMGVTCAWLDTEIRPRINKGRQFGLLIGGQTRLDAPGMQVAQSVGPELVEPVNPVLQGLPIHAADARSVSAVHAIQHGGK